MIDWSMAYLTAAALLPYLVRVQPDNEESRNTVFVVLMGLYVFAKVIMGGGVFLIGEAAIVAMVLLGWMTASMLWTRTNKSAMEVCTWGAYMALFIACMGRSPDIPVVILSVIGTAWSVSQIFRRIIGSIRWDRLFAGNPNHNSAFLLICMVASIWGIEHVDPLMVVPAILIGIAVAIGECRGGVVTLLAILAVILVNVMGAWAVPVVVAASAIAAVVIYLDPKKLSSPSRVVMFRAALRLIAKSPVYGHGMNSFRKDFPNEQRKLGVFGEPYHTHRVHNDHLETAVEVGLIGYALLWFLLMSPESWTMHYLLIILVIAVNGLFFFPLRETHTAAPFWLLVGTVGVWSMDVRLVLHPLVLVVILGACGAAMAMAVRKFLALCYYSVGVKSQDLDKKIELLDTAIALDPHNTRFLSAAMVPNSGRDPDKTAKYAMDMVSTNNGDMVLWGILDQFARVMRRVGVNSLAKQATDEALLFHSGYKNSLFMRGVLSRTIGEEGGDNR